MDEIKCKKYDMNNENIVSSLGIITLGLLYIQKIYHIKNGNEQKTKFNFHINY